MFICWCSAGTALSIVEFCAKDYTRHHELTSPEWGIEAIFIPENEGSIGGKVGLQLVMGFKLHKNSECQTTENGSKVDPGKSSEPILLNRENIFTSLELFRSGPPHFRQFQNETICYSARCELPQQITDLYPYINSSIDDAKYSASPEHLRFTLESKLIVLLPGTCAFTPVAGYGEATDILHKILDFLTELSLTVATKEPDFRKLSASSPVDIYRLLPGDNCRQCGYKTCLAFAAALARQLTEPWACHRMAQPVEERAIYWVYDSGGRPMRRIELSTAPRGSHTSRSGLEKGNHQEGGNNRGTALSPAGGKTSEDDKLIEPLTPREREVLGLVSKGLTNKEIAAHLHISDHTVKTHINHIFDKLGVHDRTQASVWAVQNGYF